MVPLSTLKTHEGKQSGINMVDLMMWLVIAALLLATAIQAIGYYQKASYLYQMQSDIAGAGTNTMAVAANNKGVIDLDAANDGVSATKWTAEVGHSVEMLTSGDVPYLRATHPGVTDLDVIYLFEDCAPFKVGVNIVPKAGSAALDECGVVAAAPAPSESAPSPSQEPAPPNDAAMNLAGWGSNKYGEIGDGTLTSRSLPTAIGSGGSALSGKTVTDISASAANACAIADGKAYCWGRNEQGQLGNGSTSQSSIPIAVDTTGVLSGKTATDISVSDSHTCVIADGKPFCWGYNLYGALGNNSTVNSLVPVAVNTSGVLAGKVLTGVTNGSSHSCAIENGNVYCWGRNDIGQFGTGNWTNSMVPVKSGFSGASAVDASNGTTCGIKAGNVYCWGKNTVYGTLGIGVKDTTAYNTPQAVTITGSPTVTSISADDYNVCAIGNGKAYCWGYNSWGAVGNGTTTHSSVPVAVNSSGVLSGKVVSSIETGQRNTCAIADGEAYCWGDNAVGEMGNGTVSATVRSPSKVSTDGILSGKEVTSLTTSQSRTIAIYRTR